MERFMNHLKTASLKVLDKFPLQRNQCTNDLHLVVNGINMFSGSLFPSNFTIDGDLKYSSTRELKILYE